MIQEIKYQGYTASPSDYECGDGELAGVMNVVPEDGSLKPVVPAEGMLALTPPQKVVFIHATRLYKHYIIVATDSEGVITYLGYVKDEVVLGGNVTISGMPSGEKLVDISAVGNILVLSTDKSVHYYYFKETAYSYLGNKLPEVDVKFALNGELVMKSDTDSTLKVIRATTTPDGDYTTIASATWESDSGGSKVRFDGITLTKGKQYKMDIQYSGTSKPRIDSFKLYGTTSEGETQRIIGNTFANNIFYGYVADKDYTNIYATTETSISELQNTVMTLFSSDVVTANMLTFENTKESYDGVVGRINSFVKREATDKGKFIHPFFVRYGLRMYDGSVARVSSPILMIPNSGCVPLMNYNSNGDGVSINLYAVTASLQIMLGDAVPSQWKDIIAGVVVYATQPVYPYDQGKNEDEHTSSFRYMSGNADGGSLTGLSTSYASISYGGDVVRGYGKHDFVRLLSDYYNFDSYNADGSWNIVQFAPYTDDEKRNDTLSKSAFYKIKEYTLEELQATSGFTDVKLDRGVLESLATREVLDGGVVPYAEYGGARLHTYNNRLHIYDSKVTLPKPTNIFLQTGYTEPSGEDAEIEGATGYDAYVFLRTSEGEKVVHQQMMGNSQTFGNLRWFFYPDASAYKVVLMPYYVNEEYYGNSVEIPLTSHDYLNGAYYLSADFDSRIETKGSTVTARTVRVDDTMYKSSVVYVSEVNNPFVFSTAKTVSVGTTHILGLASAAKALSEGQFGQFPLYAFCVNGVWALSLSDTGSYSARQPITQDILIKKEDGEYNVGSITQMDSAVLFATDRGIMLLSGSKSQCISDALDEDKVFEVSSLPKGDRVLELSGFTAEQMEYIPFKEFIRDCGMFYDYVHQRIIVFNPSKQYAYVYSLKDKAWGMIPSKITDAINSYPQAITMNSDGEVTDYSEDATGSEFLTGIKGVIYTRPFKLGDPNMLKTIDTIIQRGNIKRDHVSQVLYGSRDLRHWHLVASSGDAYLRGFRGSPYKYFRLALILNMDAGESLYGFTCQYQPRLTNKPR